MGINIGSWGTPELGISEWIGDKLGFGRDAKGGSGLVADAGQTANQNNNIQWNALQSYPADQKKVVTPRTGTGTVPVTQQVPTNTQPVNTGSGSNIDSQMMQELQNQYDSQMGILNQAGSNLATSRQTQLSGLETGASQYDRSMSSALEQALASTKGQMETTESSRQKALSENRRNLVNAQQSILSKYGTASSTGPALGELAMQSFYSTQGSIFEKGQAALNSIFKVENEANETYRLAKTKIGEELAQGKKTIEDDYMSKILQIESQKVQVGNYKSEVKMQLWNQAKQRTEQLADRAREQAFSLETWKAERLAETTGSTSYVNDLIKKLATQNFQKDIEGTTQQSLISQNTSGQTANMPAGYKPLGSSYDELDQLNPYR
ncbi:MAG: hypothetical protein ACD_19C00187G0024 [uncultured bacterium]|nr:MAG: hypothetical protein ACD_19C00187G0024 [uncultured bacterium]